MTALQRVRTALAAGERPSDDDVRAVCADAEANAQDAARVRDGWQQLFARVALTLKCLPSSFVDANNHVLDKAVAVMAEDAARIPREPTEAMLQAARKAWHKYHNGYAGDAATAEAYTWRAMHDAALAVIPASTPERNKPCL